MELRVLRYFVAVAQEGNISHAAESMRVSQPTISRQLKELEDELGVKLFERGSRTVTLTQAGEYLLTQAHQMLAISDKTTANIQQTKQISGSIIIGSAEVPMIDSLANAIRGLSEIAPEVTVNVYSTDADDVHERMNSGVFDFGVVMEPTIKNDYRFLRLPGTTPWGLLMKSDCALAQRQVITPKDVDRQRIMVSQQHSSANLLNSWLGSSDIEINIVATYNLLYNASRLTLAGVGPCLCIDGIVNTEGSGLTFVPLSPGLEAHASLVWSKSNQLSPAANAFLDVFRNLSPDIDV